MRKFYFTNRVVDAWNSLPNWIVMANSTNTFKCRLDILYCQDQEIIYDFRAQLQGTESHSDVSRLGCIKKIKVVRLSCLGCQFVSLVDTLLL